MSLNDLRKIFGSQFVKSFNESRHIFKLSVEFSFKHCNVVSKI